MKRIYDLYLYGSEQGSMGAKDIATYLNNKNLMMRAQQWNRSRVHEILSSPTYKGEYYFNKTDQKTKLIKPETEWIRLEIEPIITAATYEDARSRRAARAPAIVPPRLVNSPTLLTGLLKCGICGSGLTTATGKGGRYRYYKCNTRIGKGVHLCTMPSFPMQKLDDLVLTSLADKVFTADRVQQMLDEMKKLHKASHADQSQRLKPLQKEMESLKLSSERLFEAVEKGYLPMDETLQQRSHKLQARRQDVLLEIASLKRQKEMPTDLLKPQHIQAFSTALRAKLLDRSSRFGKDYLKLLVNDIKIDGNEAQISGSYDALA